MSENAQHELIHDAGVPALNDNKLNEIDGLLGEDDNGLDGLDAEDSNLPDNNNSDTRPDSEAAEVEESEEDNEQEPLAAEQDDVDWNQEIEINMPYGMESMTLSDMKDKISNLHISTKQVQDQENKLMVRRQEIEAIVNVIGEIPPEIRQQLDNQHQAVLVRENQLLLDAIPDWSDEKTFLNDRTSMLQLSSEYGFSESEFNTVADHRLVKLIRDYSALKNKLEKADPKKIAKQKNATGHAKRKTTKRSSGDYINEAAKSNNPQVKARAISQLLGE